MSAEIPDLDCAIKNLSLKVESDQLKDLSEGKHTIINFSDDESDNSDAECGEDSEDDQGNLVTIRPDKRKRVQTLDAQTKQSIISAEVMALEEDFRSTKLSSIKKDFPDTTELEVEPNLFASQTDDEYKSIHTRYSNLGRYSDLIRSGDYIIVIDRMIYKNTIRTGTGPLIDVNSTVIFDYACWTENCHEPYDSTWLRKKAFVTELSQDTVIPGINILLRTMKKGERAECIIKPAYAYKELGVPPRIPRNATIFCLIDVLRTYEDSSLARLLISPSRAQESGTPFATFLTFCNDARMLGNYYLQKGQAWQALERYKSGRVILDALSFKDEQEEKVANSLLIKLYNNSTNALLQLNKPRTALTFCKLALELDSHNVKAHWFYVRAWETLRHYERALRWAKKGLNIAGSYRTNFIMKIEKLQLDLKRDQKFRDDLMRKMGSCFG